MDEGRDRDEHRHSDCNRSYHDRGSANNFRDERGGSRQREWHHGRGALSVQL